LEDEDKLDTPEDREEATLGLLLGVSSDTVMIDMWRPLWLNSDTLSS
jgi:hypothetical protein